MNILTATNRNAGSFAVLSLRIMTGLILFVAGAGKAMQWFGGMGMKTTLDMFEKYMHISGPLVYVSTYTEFIGGFLLIIGLFTRPAAFLAFVNMLVATITVGSKDFFGPSGGAFPCLLMVCCLAILLAGPMLFSLDHLLFYKRGKLHSRTIHHDRNI